MQHNVQIFVNLMTTDNQCTCNPMYNTRNTKPGSLKQIKSNQNQILNISIEIRIQICFNI